MTIIVADTTCGLPHELLEERGIPVIPQIVMFGEESYHDDKEFDTTVFLQKLKASATLPKTSAPEPSLYFPIFEEAKKEGESVVVVAPTSKASGTVRSAQTAAQEFPGLDVRVVDTLTVACNLGSLVLVADDMAKAGKSADEIVAKLNDLIPRGRLYFVVDTLEYLAKGGRIGGAKKLLAELLEIKPILQVKNGQVESFEQQRTKRRALARIVEGSFVCATGCG
jgi:DegV family protein with EDD domain